MKIVKYILHPTYIEPIKGNYKRKILSLFKNYFIVLFLLFLIVILLSELIDPFVIKQGYPSILNKSSRITTLYVGMYGSFIGFMLSVFIVPFIEELWFRLPLKLTPLALSIPTFIFVYKILKTNMLKFNFSSVSDYVMLLLSIFIAFVIYKILCLPYFLERLDCLKTKYYHWIFYLGAFIFGIFHFSHFKPIHIEILYVYPLYVLPQMITGLFFASFRMNYGFWWGCAFHFLYNGVFMVFKLL